jgi:outer membrane protein assembly factor BamB
MGDTMKIEKVISFIFYVGGMMTYMSCEKEHHIIPLYEIPPIPNIELVKIEENPPGNDDRIFGLPGAVCNDCKVIVFGNEELTREINSQIANDDGSFLPISIGDNLYGKVFLLVENEIGFRSPYIVLQNDIVPPDTEITEFPSNPTEITSTMFKFSCNEDECTFECKIDNGEWERCTSPKTYFLNGGEHTFEVMAIDRAGNKDSSPSSYSWRIEPRFHGSILWSFSQIEKVPERVGEGYAPSPPFGDIDGDGKLEVVIAPYNVVHAINGEDGSLLWSYPIPFSYSIPSPLLADIDGDGKLEVVVGGDKIYALNGEDGSILWFYETGNGFVMPYSIGDVDKNGTLDVVGGNGYSIYAINGEDGSLMWFYDAGEWLFPSSLGDIDGDGKLEVVIAPAWTKNKIFALNGEDGSLLWTSSVELEGALPVLGDIDSDGKIEVVANSDANIYAFNGEDGSLLWMYEIPSGSQPPSLADIDNDGKLEVVAPVYSEKKIYAINGEDGSLLWKSYRTSDYVSYPAIIGDIDNDGKVEILGVSAGVYLYAINGEDGSLLWIFDELGCCIDAPSLTDINGDGVIDMLIYDGMNPEMVYAISMNVPAPPSELLPWILGRHDVKGTNLYTGGPNPPW